MSIRGVLIRHIMLLSLCIFCNAKVHVFGDSHAYFCFSNFEYVRCFNEQSIFCLKQKNNEERYIEFDIHYIGPVTMHRIGRDGFAILNVRDQVQEGDTIVFVFGEIDVRCHIGRQCNEKGRSIEEVINTLVGNYFRTISENVKDYSGVNIVIMGTVPPRDPAPELISLPLYGSLQDRVRINNFLCVALEKACFEHGYYFLDIRSYFSDFDGSLNFELSDGNVHVGLPHNRIIKEKLFNLPAQTIDQRFEFAAAE